uniref:macrophage mannose receptor 1-like n=1 Tax=Semicossyphus pulcher TaxID=241346 RepID=UPI0037E9152B
MTENKFFRMKRTQTLYLLFISGFCSLALGSSEFHLVNQLKTFNEAKTFCRQMFTDLASVHNLTEMNKLFTLVSANTSRAFIGLENGGVWRWHWSSPDQKVDFFNWREGEPQVTNEAACAVMDPSGQWFESGCGTKRSFVCQGNSDTGDLIFVAETKSWRNAQNHCRGLSSDLSSIHSPEDNEAVRNISVSQNVWIGLFKDPWKWSDGSNSSFRFWKPGQPNYLEGQDCAVGIFKDDGRWNDLRCTGKRNFVCRGARKLLPVTTIQPSTQLSASTNLLLTNLTTLLNTSFDVTTTVHVIVTPFNQSNTTNVTSEKEETVTSLTPNTTYPVSSTSSTEPNSATTLMSNVTATQLPANTTTQATTGVVSASTTLKGTTAKTTTQPSSTTQPLTLKPTEHSQNLPPGNLILIKKNLTWIEAMSYCRRHHIDLVHIPTKDIQQRVAETAKNATSPYVWLGLRYTCNFNFWFWISSSTGCYQNWAPGQGAEGKYPCDATGAVEATGGQQWVGLPETEKLNFICSSCAG